MSNKNTKRGRQWEEGVVLPISDSFFITKDKARVPITEKVYKELRRSTSGYNKLKCRIVRTILHLK